MFNLSAVKAAENSKRYVTNKIHVSELASHDCDRYLWLTHSGQYSWIPDENILWAFLVGKGIHSELEKECLAWAEQNGAIGFSEVKVETDNMIGSIDLVIVYERKKTIDIIDIKSTGAEGFFLLPSESMINQVNIYVGALLAGGFKALKNIKVTKDWNIGGQIWKVNKTGRPRYFDVEQDAHPIQIDLDIYRNAEKRAEKISSALKGGYEIKKEDGQKCAGCPARLVCEGLKSIEI